MRLIEFPAENDDFLRAWRFLIKAVSLIEKFFHSLCVRWLNHIEMERKWILKNLVLNLKGEKSWWCFLLLTHDSLNWNLVTFFLLGSLLGNFQSMKVSLGFFSFKRNFSYEFFSTKVSLKRHFQHYFLWRNLLLRNLQ